MSFNFSIPTPAGQLALSVESGSSIVFVGANGGGKTRLAVMLEDQLSMRAHRISAQRSLAMNPDVAKIREELALAGLRTGHAAVDALPGHRQGNRWQGKAAVALLNDFDFLLQALFADQSNRSLVTHKQVRAGMPAAALPTKFEALIAIWQRLLPHRALSTTGDDIQVSVAGSAQTYKSSDMSDGERAIFYMIGQALVAAKDSMLIVDEPELHVHRSIMSKLWDELEAARPDCSFIFITHDLEFAAARAAQKFVVSNYLPNPVWTIEAVPEHDGFTEEIATLILGSRRPVLFAEGTGESLDQAIYRCCFPGWTVLARGSCDEVIHSVASMRRNAAFTRLACRGIVDADGRDAAEVAHLETFGVACLPVAEIENLILLPSVSRAIAEGEGLGGAELEARLTDLASDVFSTLEHESAIEAQVAQHCRRRIDALLKRLDLGPGSTATEIDAEYRRASAEVDVQALASAARARIVAAIAGKDLPALLRECSNKGWLALAAHRLRQSKRRDFESWITRMLRGGHAPRLSEAIAACLPRLDV